MNRYCVKQAAQTPAPDDFGWDSGVWEDVEELVVGSFHADGSDHRPDTRVKMVYDADATLHLLYRVEDCYVRSVRTERQQSVCLDSCVEFFMWPKPDSGYINFEMNCGGTFLSKYYADPFATVAERHKTSVRMDADVLDNVIVCTTMPPVVEPELTEPTTYFVRLTVPIRVIESKLGTLTPLAGQTWRANFFKCGDETSHPHWGSWNPIGDVLSFHQPATFGEIVFA